MKAFTDIEQSKKLAEILPIDSADMHYHYCFDFDELESIPTITEEDDHFVLFPKDIKCWSLAALIELMVECRMERTPLDQSGEFTYSFVDDYYNIRTFEEDNAVDAAVEMILKLKEQDLL